MVRTGSAIPALALILAGAGCRTTATHHPSMGMTSAGEMQSAEEVLLWQVDARGADARSCAVAARLRQGVQQGLLSRGLRIADDAGDIRLAIAVEAEEFDRAGNYYVFAGKAAGEVRVWDPHARAKDLVGRVDVAARGERKLGEADALAGLSDRLIDGVLEQVSGPADSLARRIAVETVQVTLPWLSRGSDRALAEYAVRFVKVVGGMEGVLDCRLIARDPEAGAAAFRIAYRKDAFPAGLPNALLLKPELGLSRVR